MSNSLLLLLFYFSLKGGWGRGHTHTHTSVGLPAWVSTRPAACQSLMDQQQDQHARRPREPTCVWSSSLLLFALFLPISCLIFFCMNSSLACSDILIPQPNLPHPNHTHIQHIYLRELIKSLSSLFSPPTTSLPTSLSPFLITKDTVIIAGWGGGGGRGQKRRAHVCRHGQTCQA